MAGLFLGIDAGTTAVKAVLFNESGKPLRSSSREGEIVFIEGGGAEIDLEAYWDLTADCVHAITRSDGIDKNDIKALAVSAQGVTFAPVDGGGGRCGPPFHTWTGAARRRLKSL